MTKYKNLTTNELIVFEKLIIENRDNAKLQRITKLSYLESITLLNKIARILGRY